MTEPIHVIDSHTAGEPTRLIIQGGPPLGAGPLADRVQRFRDDFDHFRTAVVTEPRGSDVLVGALLCEPQDSSCAAGVIFFNNAGYLGMCGHGLMGVVESLRHLGRIADGQYRIETPVGVVTATLHCDRSVSVRNVASYRSATDVRLRVDGVGTVVGDVAWGGNWFFVVHQPSQPVRLDCVAELRRIASDIRHELNGAGFPEVDHVELFDASTASDADSRNFVLCPGLEYDRSPCGTGTSAKLACLAADGKLTPGQTWVQEGILGSRFIGQYQWSDESQQRVDPTITGSAYVTADAQLILNPRDPFCWGLGRSS